jgi:hypothetical protein
MAKFSDRDVGWVLEGLKLRYPEATAEDALTILQDGEWAAQDEADQLAREDAERGAELEFMAVSA